jgi:uncharacterized membrane protein SpoIIM required for sporulation
MTFIERRKTNWRRLEELLNRARGVRGVRRLGRDEVRELGRAYRRAASDLAIARVESRDQRLINYLNNLVIRTHSLIYRAQSRGASTIFRFYRSEFPAVFRRTSRYTLAIFLIFVALAIFSFGATWRDDEFVDFAYVGRQLLVEIRANRMWTDDLNKQAPFGAAYIMTNNIGVGLKTFALSIIPIVGTVEVLRPSAMQFGAINALVVKYKMHRALWSFVAAHGVLELTAIFIAGGAGLMIGLAIVAPGERTRRDALLESGGLAIKLLAGCIPMLIIAGLIEAFISPTPIHPGYKIAVSAVTGIALAIYFLSSPPAEPIKSD